MSRSYIFAFALAACAYISSSPFPAQAAETAELVSATKARDINGFELGDSISTIRQRMQLISLGSGEFEGEHQETKYRLAFSPLGRLYHIESVQSLGTFTIDRRFLAELNSRLVSKYGPTSTRERNPWSWQVVEAVTLHGDIPMRMATHWMSAMTSHSDNEVTVELRMVDFRILWQDQAHTNLAPWKAAESKIEF